MKKIEQQLIAKGYVKIVKMGEHDEAQLKEYTEALRMSPQYVDHVTVYTEESVIVYAKKLNKSVSESGYRAPIIERLDKQTSVGLNKYKSLLQDNNLNTMARLEYLAEELTDGLQYIEHVKESMVDVFDDLAGVASTLMMESNKCSSVEARNSLIEVAKRVNNLLGKVMGYESDEQGRKEDSGQSK